MMIKNVLFALLCLSLSACATSPTGRTRLLMVTDTSIAPMAIKSFDQLKQKEKISNNTAANQLAHCVATPLIAEARARYGFLTPEWEIVVFDSDAVNAFAMPGGKIGIYTGLMDLTENPEQLAAVLGHEIGHVVAQHAAERMSTAQMTILAMTAAGVVLSNNKDEAAIMAALGIGAQIGIQLPFSRIHETEADEIGEELMARAGFDPLQSIRLWQLMEKQGGPRPPQILSTHPEPQNRAAHLQDMLSTTQPLFRNAQKFGKHPQCVMPVKPVTTKVKKNGKKK